MGENIVWFLLGFAACLFIVASIRHWMVYLDIIDELKNKSNNNKNDSDMRHKE